MKERVARLSLLAGAVASVALGTALQPAVASAQSVDPATCARLARLGVELPLIILPGDLDRDGDVDIFDYNILIRDFDKTGPNLQADINHDQRVDEIDYRILLATYGFRSPCRPGDGSTGGGTAPPLPTP